MSWALPRASRWTEPKLTWPRFNLLGAWVRLQVWAGSRPELMRAAGLYALLFAGLCLAGAMSVQLDRPTRVQGTWIQLLLRPDEPNPEVVKIWERWDALWYMQIAHSGYHATDNTVAFFPLYPGLMHLVGAVLRQNYALAGLIVSGLALVAALWLLQLLGQQVSDPGSARRAVLYTVLYPTAFFFLAPYTESLFLLLAVGVFWFMHRRRWAWAGLFGLLAGLTRAPGALLVLPMAWEWLEQRLSGERRPWPTFLWTVTPGLGLLLFTGYIRFILGLPEAGLATQAAWGYHVVTPWQAVATSFARARIDPIEAINLSSLVVACALTVMGIKRLPTPYTLYNLGNIGVMLTRIEDAWPLMSVSRYVLVLFPAFLMLGMAGGRWRWLNQAIRAIGLLAMAMLFYHYVHFRFVA